MRLTEKKILKAFNNDVYCRIGLSKIHGVGVIAIKSIPFGIDPFAGCQNYKKTLHINSKQIKKLPRKIQDYVKDFFPLEKGYYKFPDYHPQQIDASYYMNHSDNPNIDSFTTPDGVITFKSNKKIYADDELTVNYKHFDEQKF